MSAWSEFYKGRVSSGYVEYVKNRYAPHIQQISKFLSLGKRVLEIGAGIGTITVALQETHKNINFTVSDNDLDMLSILKERISNVLNINCKNSTLNSADIVHSHGLLEHMNDADILKVIHNNKHAQQIHYVPGLYNKPSFGDERLLSLSYWIKLTKPDFYFTFNNGLDYILGYNKQ